MPSSGTSTPSHFWGASTKVEGPNKVVGFSCWFHAAPLRGGSAMHALSDGSAEHSRSAPNLFWGLFPFKPSSK